MRTGMRRPDGMGMDRHRERENMRAAAHEARDAPVNWAVVRPDMTPIQDGFDSEQEARDWARQRQTKHPEPEWDMSEVEIRDIG